MWRLSLTVFFYIYLKHSQCLSPNVFTFFFKCPYNTTPYMETSDTYAAYHSYMVPFMNKIRYELVDDEKYEQLKKRVSEFNEFVDNRVSVWEDRNQRYPHTEEPASLPDFEDFFYSKYYVPFANMIRFNICGVSNAPYTKKAPSIFFTTRKFYDMRKHTYTINYEEWARRVLHERIFTDSDYVTLGDDYGNEDTTVVANQSNSQYRDKFVDLILNTKPMNSSVLEIENTTVKNFLDLFTSTKASHSSLLDIGVFPMRKKLPKMKGRGKGLKKKFFRLSHRESILRSSEDRTIQK